MRKIFYLLLLAIAGCVADGEQKTYTIKVCYSDVDRCDTIEFTSTRYPVMRTSAGVTCINKKDSSDIETTAVACHIRNFVVIKAEPNEENNED